MSNAIALARDNVRKNADFARMVIVLGSALALIFAGAASPL